MNNQNMGKFISELRKSNHMTQKDLAAKLNITDKAVSKWERGLSCPDISLLSSIADIFGITTSELLNSEKKDSNVSDVEASIDNALQYAEKAVKNRAKYLQDICSIVFSLLLLIGIVVCAICDNAISGAFTWSLFPISSIVFAWLVFFPVIKLGEKGIWITMIVLSVLVIPFLFVLNALIKTNDLLLPIGVKMAVISIIFLWMVFILFKIFRTRKLIASAISLVLAIPFHVLINFSLSKIIDDSLIDVWDILSLSIISIAVVILFTIDFIARKKQFQ